MRFLERSASSPSETFSCTPTFRGDSPSATPSNCVKYSIFTVVFSPSTFSARTWCISSPV
jgi:hypothetical protein